MSNASSESLPGRTALKVLMQWLSDIHLPAVSSGIQRARSVAGALPVTLDDEARDDLRLLVSEVVTNAVRHGGSQAHETDERVRVRMGVEGRRLRVEVFDGGAGFRPARRRPDADPGSGWGVHFVRELADRWGTAHDAREGSVVWFELRLPEQDAADRGRRTATPDGRASGRRDTVHRLACAT